MSAVHSLQNFRYPFPSDLLVRGRQGHLRLATFHKASGKETHPFFFEGELANSKRTADMLRAIMTIVKSRFHVPAAMLSRIMWQSDPVVTSNDELLRFEGFSACAGVYVRLDLNGNAFSGKPVGRGTTNVDFNQPMIAALARVKKQDKVRLSVGADELVLQNEQSKIVEKKVKMPVRWMKGFVEVQSIQSRMELVHDVPGLQAYRFLRGLPRMKTHRRKTYVTASGTGLRLSQVESDGSVQVGGLERLQVLEDLSKDSQSLRVFAESQSGCSAWVLSFDDCRFQLVISPEVWRGFSGEGQALSSIAKKKDDVIPKVQAMLKWQSRIEVERLARTTKLSKDVVEDALKVLGSRGLVGFDLSEQSYYHREMPFDFSEVEKLQPRLKAARKLLEVEKLSIKNNSNSVTEVSVPSKDVVHRVKFEDNDVGYKCTCPWFNQHQNRRGPCKHVLAAQIYLEEMDEIRGVINH